MVIKSFVMCRFIYDPGKRKGLLESVTCNQTNHKQEKRD